MNKGIIGAIAAVIVIAIIAAGSWYTVDQTERGVRLRFGAHRDPVRLGWLMRRSMDGAAAAVRKASCRASGSAVRG